MGAGVLRILRISRISRILRILRILRKGCWSFAYFAYFTYLMRGDDHGWIFGIFEVQHFSTIKTSFAPLKRL